ncbi:MAG: tail fiber domain-containing protein [Chromatiaceae bacterium]
MTEIATKMNAPQGKPLPEKRLYRQPALQVFGKLHLMTQGSGGSGLDAGNTHTKKSDRLAKERIIRIGTHPLGIGLYLFDYKPEHRDAWGHGRQFGVMADEVEAIMPQAVSVDPDGNKVVNYGLLGISHTLQ